MAKNSYGAIVEIEGTDLISESMDKINENFKILAEKENQDEYKWESYVDSVASKISDLIASNEYVKVQTAKQIKNFEDLINGVNSQISAIRDRLASIENRLDEIESRLDDLISSDDTE